MILCGDIGGTKAQLALAGDDGRIVHERRIECAGFSGFASLLGDYLSQIPRSTIAGGCLAVAGPIDDEGVTARFTNLPWIIDTGALARQFALGPLRLVNDFTAAAMGVTTLGAEDLLTLQQGEPRAGGVKLVVGAGTGLGMAILVPDGHGYRVLPGEGGHAGFAPANELQGHIWEALLKEHGRVTSERVISGPGIAATHRILTGETASPARIAERALAGEAGALATINVFLHAYGAFAGDMAMAAMARGGVYIAGGIVLNLLPLLRQGVFLAAFNAKAEHAGLAARMPVHAATDPRLGLRGAALLAGNLHGR